MKNIILSIIFTALIISGCNSAVPQSNLPPTSNSNEVNTPQNIEVNPTTKTYEGTNFTFQYPSIYIADSKGLWTKEDYNNREQECATCNVPYIGITSEQGNESLEKYILKDTGYSEYKSLDELKKVLPRNYEKLKIGDYEFIKLEVGELYSITAYYTKHNNQFVSFKVYFEECDQDELKQIISSIKFKK